MASEELPDWERLFAAERHLQSLLPGAVLVGQPPLPSMPDIARASTVTTSSRTCAPASTRCWLALEAAGGGHTSRVKRPVAILGRLDGVMTGIRQLRRTRPLESELVSGLRVPTLLEMALFKAWLLATRHTVRDYLDTVVLIERLGEAPLGARSRSSTTSIPRWAVRRLWPRSSSGWPPRRPRTRPRWTFAPTRA